MAIGIRRRRFTFVLLAMGALLAIFLLNNYLKEKALHAMPYGFKRFNLYDPLPEVVEAANRIAKPSIEELEAGYGIKVCTAMLNACDLVDGKWRYREIYINSKLLLIDDIFLTLGSANLNQRSMAVDSEINLAAISPHKASDLRKKIWSQLTNDEYFGGHGSRKEIALSFKGWCELMSNNFSNKKAKEKISCPILPFEDKRSSILRLG